MSGLVMYKSVESIGALNDHMDVVMNNKPKISNMGRWTKALQMNDRGGSCLSTMIPVTTTSPLRL